MGPPLVAVQTILRNGRIENFEHAHG
jgi:hypothetical protein